MYRVTSKVNHFLQLGAGAVLGPGESTTVDTVTATIESQRARGRVEITDLTQGKKVVETPSPPPTPPPPPPVVQAQPKPAPVETVPQPPEDPRDRPFEVTTNEIAESMKEPPKPVDPEPQAEAAEESEEDESEPAKTGPALKTDDDEEDDLGSRMHQGPKPKQPVGGKKGRR